MPLLIQASAGFHTAFVKIAEHRKRLSVMVDREILYQYMLQLHSDMSLTRLNLSSVFIRYMTPMRNITPA